MWGLTVFCVKMWGKCVTFNNFNNSKYIFINYFLIIYDNSIIIIIIIIIFIIFLDGVKEREI